MPRAKPRSEFDLQITVSPQVFRELFSLVDTGLFGVDVNDVAHGLLRERLREILLQRAPYRREFPELKR